MKRQPTEKEKIHPHYTSVSNQYLECTKNFKN